MECRQALSQGTTLSISASNHQSFGLPASICALPQSFCASSSKGLGPVHGLLETGCTAEVNSGQKPASFVPTAAPHGSHYQLGSGNKLRAPNDFALWWVVWLFPFWLCLNVILIKCKINAMHLNHPETIHHYASLGPCFHKTSPRAQNGGDHSSARCVVRRLLCFTASQIHDVS